MEKVELLQEILDISKCYKFNNELLILSGCYNDKKIYVNFTGLIETMYEKLSEEDINRILWTTEEYKEHEESEMY